MSKIFRYYQEEADHAIYEELLINDKCIVKMFCGTGKSLLMRNCKIVKNQNLVVYVFPSLPLIEQFCSDYFDKKDCFLKISSDKEKEEYNDDYGEKKIKKNDSTTEPSAIIKFIKKNKNKIICVTYQSYETLLECLDKTVINVCIYDEAHRSVGETYQKLIFETEYNKCEKQIFFTATPKNANGIVMYDRENVDAGMCGKLVYDYSYLTGMNEGYLNPFEIRIDMYTENTNKSIYESIARATLVSGNNRILTFHADVNTDRDTSVNNFVNEKEFKRVFLEVMVKEFPEKAGLYKKFKMIPLVAKTKNRKKILDKLEKTPDDEIYIISSCGVIREGIDTKCANMCVFVDPKTSYVDIIQNLGRVVRKQSISSIILIPCWIDKEKYIGCGGDKEKCDEVIRQDMSERGNYNGILNVMSALKQEDEDLYDICLHYPDTYSPQEIINNLENQGYEVLDQIGDGSLLENMEYILDTEIDYEEYDDCDSHEEMIMCIAEDNDVCVEIHTNSLENPVETYNSECDSGEIIRLYKDEDEIYCPIVKKCGKKRNTGSVQKLNKNHRPKINVHTNPDVKVLWNITGDFTKDVCSCVLDCEVVVGYNIEKWKENLQKVQKYIDDNKNRPSSTSKDVDIRKLGQWIIDQTKNYDIDIKKSNYIMKNVEEIHNLWSNFINDTNYNKYFKTNIEKWKENLQKVQKYIDDNKNRPSSKSKDADIRKLGEWIKDQTKIYDIDIKKSNKIMKNVEEIHNLWSDFINDPKYKPYLFQEGIWETMLQKNKDYMDINKRRPSSKDKNKETASLGNWLVKQTKIYDTDISKSEGYLADEKIHKMWSDFINDSKYKLYMSPIDNVAEFEITLHNVKKYIDDNKKLPSSSSKNNETKKLGQWISNKKQNYDIDIKKCKEGMKDKKIHKMWSDFINDIKYKRLVSYGPDRWEIDLQDVKEYVKKNKRLPPACGITSKLGKWIQTQKENFNIDIKHSKQIMNDVKIHDLWSKFLKEYNEYFKDTINLLLASSSEETPITEEPKPTPKKKSMKLKTTAKKETTEQKRQRTKTEISELHQRYKTLNSQNLNKEFKEKPELWHKYHEISEENEKSFPKEDIPRNRIIQELDEIKTKRTKLIVDMGCGKAQIAQHFKDDKRFSFTNYDHVSSNDTVISQDISQIPLEDHSVEICILSLAMWGSNCHDYVKEANRILESNGKLYIMEPTKRWSEQDEHGNIMPEKEGSKMIKLLEEHGFQITKSNIEKFCLFECIKIN